MIYCVEDEKNIRELLIYTLETTGFSAKGMANAKELRIALKEEFPDSSGYHASGGRRIQHTGKSEIIKRYQRNPGDHGHSEGSRVRQGKRSGGRRR